MPCQYTLGCTAIQSVESRYQIIPLLGNYVSIITTLAQMEDPTQHTDLPDLIVLRHGQTTFNRGYLDYVQTNDPSLTWQSCLQIDDFRTKVAYAQQHFDCNLTTEGVQQCQAARATLSKEDIDIVLVSPHQRALETCRQIFGDRKIPVEVHPVIAEVFRYSCDISRHYSEKQQQFPNYDFSHMKDHSELWFVEILTAKHNQSCQNHFEKQQPQTYLEKQQRILQLLKEKTVYETPQELRERIWKIKDLLQEYRKKYKKIAVVSHYNTITSLIAKEYDPIGKAVNIPHIPNASPYYLNIAKLLKIK